MCFCVQCFVGVICLFRATVATPLMCLALRSHTSYQSNFTPWVFIGAAHHSPNCVINQSYYVQVKVLQKHSHSSLCLNYCRVLDKRVTNTSLTACMHLLVSIHKFRFNTTSWNIIYLSNFHCSTFINRIKILWIKSKEKRIFFSRLIKEIRN